MFLPNAWVPITMEPMTLFSHSARQCGPLLICSGLFIIVLTHFWLDWPVVSGIALVGWGALRTLHSGSRSAGQDALSMVNLTIYSSLVCLAIVAQSQVVLKQGAEKASTIMLFDHAAAIMLILGLASHVARRLSQPLAEE